MTVFQISLADVRQLAFYLARFTMEWDEPIPEFETRSPGKLESCLLTPFQAFGQKDLYPDLITKASILFYLMIKNHPFENGNKRIAVTTLFCFLSLNGKWLKVHKEDLYKFAVLVAQSEPAYRAEFLSIIQKFIKTNLVDSEV